MNLAPQKIDPRLDNPPSLALLDMATRPVPPTALPSSANAEIPLAIVDEQRFVFTGTGAEYFRIWVVNLLLTILSLGVYSAWAKVRRLQYFYRNTQLAGATFDYHGNPKAILKGRILALGLLIAYKIATDLSAIATVIVALLLAAVLPWLLARAFRFKMVNSSYRGLRFRFHGSVANAYRTLILFPIVLALTGFFVWTLITSFAQRPSWGVIIVTGILPLLALAAIVPLAHFYLKRYQMDNAYYGQTPFFIHLRALDFFKVYGRAVGFLILGFFTTWLFSLLTRKIYLMLAATMFGWLFSLLYGALSAYAFYLLVRAFLESRLQNMVWNQTELSDHQFASTASARQLFFIHASNLVFITLSAGLYKPFGVVRLIKYKVESMSLLPAGDLEEFLADQSAETAGGLGQEAGDLFDIDIAL